MRHRERGAITPTLAGTWLQIRQRDDWYHDSVLTSSTYLGDPDNDHWEVMPAVLGGYEGSIGSIFDSTGGRYGNNHPCIHNKKWVVDVSYPQSGVNLTPYTEDYGSTQLVKRVEWRLTRPITASISSLPEGLTPEMATGYGQLGNLFDDHFMRVAVGGSAKMSLANFLLEITDLKRAANSLSEVFTDPKKFESPALAWEFGVKPFFSDLKSLAQGLANMSRTYESLRDANSKPIRITTTRNVVVDQELDFGSPPTTGTGVYLSPSRNEIRAVMVSKVAYDFSDWDPVALAAFTAAKVFGVTNPIKVGWNWIPYSFCADWVYNVSGLLNKLDLARLAFVHNRVISTTTSIKWIRELDSVLYSHGFPTSLGNGYNTVPHVPIGKFREEFYQRWVGVPLEKDLVRKHLEDLSIRKLVLSLLLGSQLLPKRKMVKWFTSPKAWWNRPSPPRSKRALPSKNRK